MSSVLITLIAAFILLICATIGLGLGYILTGKSKFSYRKCGYHPHDQKDKTKKKKCNTCGK